MTKVAIKAENLGKKFLIGHQKEGDLRSSFGRAIRQMMKGGAVAREVFWALKDIFFDIKEGETIGIVGLNGAGKSTLLKILSRITDPTTGRFEINGRVSSLLEVGTGFHPELTGRENIFLNGTILGMRRAEIKSKFDAIVDFSGVEKFIDTPVKHYSSGMKVRLAFSVAAYLEPEILIIDEVLAVGDAEFQKKCLGKMDEVSKKEGRTILFVSHNMGAIENLCSRAMLLQAGTLRHTGNVDEVVALYLSAEKNEVRDGEMSLRNDLFLKEFFVDRQSIFSNESLQYRVHLVSRMTNRISDLAILVYNHLNERVAIIDLRDEDLFKVSARKNGVIIDGTINNISLVEGTYHLGLYISSSLCRGDFLNLRSFEVKTPSKEFIPYAVSHRGYVTFENTFSISSE